MTQNETNSFFKSLTNDFYSNLKHQIGSRLRSVLKNLIYVPPSYTLQNETLSAKFKEKLSNLNTQFIDYKFHELISNCTYEEAINELQSLNDSVKHIVFYSTQAFNFLLQRTMTTDTNVLKESSFYKFCYKFKTLDNIKQKSYDELFKSIFSNKSLRRPCDGFKGYYRYIPIKCNNFCDSHFNDFGKLMKKLNNELYKITFEDRNNAELFYSIKKDLV